MARRLHEDELVTDVDTVRALLTAHAGRWAGLPVRPLAATGSSNALYGLGDDLLVRLPRQPGGSATIRKEARWGRQLASTLPVAVPEVLLVGAPGAGYPEQWSVVRWLEGGTPPAGGPSSPALARDVAELVRSLRDAPVPEEARADVDLRWYRGGPLGALDDDVRAALAASEPVVGDRVDLAAALEVWEATMALPGIGERVPVGEERWLHGDLLAENLLVDDGRLAGLLDLGGLAVGDPTVDLAVAWEVLDAPGRAAFRGLVAVDEGAWLRGRGWALAIAAITFPYYAESMPARCADRLVMLQAVLDDAAAAQAAGS